MTSAETRTARLVDLLIEAAFDDGDEGREERSHAVEEARAALLTHIDRIRPRPAPANAPKAQRAERAPMEHDLKCWCDPFDAMKRGDKTHELRRNDRDYRVGDTLLQRRYEPTAGVYTGETLRRVVTYITPGGAFGLPDDLCVMSTAPADAGRACDDGIPASAIASWESAMRREGVLTCDHCVTLANVPVGEPCPRCGRGSSGEGGR